MAPDRLPRRGLLSPRLPFHAGAESLWPAGKPRGLPPSHGSPEHSYSWDQLQHGPRLLYSSASWSPQMLEGTSSFFWLASPGKFFLHRVCQDGIEGLE